MEDIVELNKFSEENKSLAANIHSLFTVEQIKEFSLHSLVYLHYQDQYGYKVNISFNGGPGYHPDGFATQFPQGFTFPAFAITEHYDEEVKMIDWRFVTPKGILPEMFIGGDGKLYSLSVEYYIKELGQGCKFSALYCITDITTTDDEVRYSSMSLEAQLEDYLGTSDYPSITQVDFVPTEEDLEKPMELETGDYEKIRHILHSVETGNLTLKQVYF